METSNKEELKLHILTRETKKVLADNIKIANFNGNNIEVKQYLPVQDKINLVGTAFVSGKKIKDGLEVIDDCSIIVAFRLLLVQAYTNIKYNNNLKNYDLLCETGLYDLVRENIPMEELNNLEEMLHSVVRNGKSENKQRNSIVFIIKGLVDKMIDFFSDEKGVDKFIKKMDKFIVNAKKVVDGFDPNKMDFVKEFMVVNSGKNIGSGEAGKVKN